jgi:hypothetical protein
MKPYIGQTRRILPAALHMHNASYHRMCSHVIDRVVSLQNVFTVICMLQDTTECVLLL